ncbi:hypothetical protein GCM10010435_79600 [Winogradskya consettensis]|uniref:Uncharacterized protein n=1 Tax=Winogradskya consettensis TaxID=113560 RepID=A0A919VUQ9_9ACTN|nr:hypothetical protein Aco04nite_55360 [Actinoplanes consettensis]
MVEAAWGSAGPSPGAGLRGANQVRLAWAARVAWAARPGWVARLAWVARPGWVAGVAWAARPGWVALVAWVAQTKCAAIQSATVFTEAKTAPSWVWPLRVMNCSGAL